MTQRIFESLIRYTLEQNGNVYIKFFTIFQLKPKMYLTPTRDQLLSYYRRRAK